MRVVVIWRDNTDYAREVTTWIQDFERLTGKKIESLDPDTVEGEIFVKARDIVEYPTIVAIDNDGRVLKMWSRTMPLFDEIVYYTRET